jgi:hypothetical protein
VFLKRKKDLQATEISDIVYLVVCTVGLAREHWEAPSHSVKTRVETVKVKKSGNI